MKKQHKLVIIIVSIALVLLIILTAVFIFVQKSQEETIITSDGTKVIVQKLIKCPDVGEGGNDFDNTFRSLTVSPTDPDVVYVGNEGNGVFKTVDGGVIWAWIRTGLKHEGGHYPEVYNMAIDVNDESVILAATTNGPSPIWSSDYKVSVTAGVYRSEDGGELWRQNLEGLPNSAIVSLVQFPGRKDTFLIGLDGLESSRDNYSHLETGGGIYISEDGGGSWSALPIPDEGVKNRYAKLYVRGEDKNPVFYTAGIRWKKEEGSSQSRPDLEGSIGLLRGDDEGQTWTEINPGNAFVLYFDVSADGNTIFAGDIDNNILHISDNRGENWRSVFSRGIGAIKISPNNKDKVLYANGNQLVLTEDGFATDVVVLDTEQSINDIEYFKQDNEIIYVSTAGFMVYKSIDGGRSFEKMVNLRDVIEGS